ncbi:regulator of sigma E protease [Salinibacillus kushneri]|uniref:Zinc metalloprotease n=1 Tax=Salinibacillus kushneri TaxID=237682 RepID=A0A1I0E6P7_9BACI|nr:RIP metalloprotease RseP [Salinibacillus kushneri]SET40673.1 regulator of sigma E protease [Salinibacillus kushneri]
MNTVIAFIFMFGLLVFIHEFGHMIFAKRAGMLVREFAIGFGPKIFSYRKKETLYTIRLLPIGGYVRVAGEDPEIIELKPGHHIGLEFNESDKVEKIIVNNKSKHPNARVIEVEGADLDHELVITGYDVDSEERLTFDVDPKAFFIMDENETQIAPYDRQFASKSVPKKAMQIFAGPMMNFVLAIIVFIILGFAQGVPVEEAQLGEISENYPAAESGLQQGDRILQVDNQSIDTWVDFVMEIQEHPNEEVELMVDRNGEVMSVPITPDAIEEQGKEIGQIGVRQAFEHSPGEIVKFGFTETYELSTLILTSVGQLVTGQLSIDSLAGPVGIYDVTDQAVQTGFYTFLTWTAMLSVNLGIINLLPLPALDGGRLIFIGYEAVRGKPIDPQKEGIVHFLGFALLMLLMIVVTWNDIQRLFTP